MGGGIGSFLKWIILIKKNFIFFEFLGFNIFFLKKIFFKKKKFFFFFF
jgi:hypothetical protein